jgi:hypothetical protein
MQQTNTKYCRSRPYRNRRAQKGTSRCLTWAGVGRLSVSASATMRCVRRGVSLTIPARTRSRTKNRRMSMCREKNLRKTSHNQNRQDFQTYRYKRDCLADWHDWLRDARARKTCGTKDNFRLERLVHERQFQVGLKLSFVGLKLSFVHESFVNLKLSFVHDWLRDARARKTISARGWFWSSHGRSRPS